MPVTIKNIVGISDTHFGSQYSICPPKVKLDAGGFYTPSVIQRKLWTYWEDFWEWTYDHLDGAPFVLAHIGDVIDGQHHGSVDTVSGNLEDQTDIAVNALKPHVNKAHKYFQIRGTEAHSGKSAQEEEAIAKALGAERDKETGAYSRYELTIKFGPEIVHFAHHIGTTTSTAYESSALMREIATAFVESGQWGVPPATIYVRGHRHRYMEVKARKTRIVVCPGWQAKTPWVHRIDRLRVPQFGGLIIRLGEEGVHIRERLYTISHGIDVQL